MKKEYLQSDENLRNKVEGFEMTPPAHAWSGIEAGLASSSSSKRKGFFFYFSILAIVLIGSSLGAFFLLQSTSDHGTFGSLTNAENFTGIENPIESKDSKNTTTYANVETNKANQKKNSDGTKNSRTTSNDLHQNEKHVNSKGNLVQVNQVSGGSTFNVKNNKVQSTTANMVATSNNGSNAASTSLASNNPSNQNSNGNGITGAITDHTVQIGSGTNETKTGLNSSETKQSIDLNQPKFLEPYAPNQLATGGNIGLISSPYKPAPFKKGTWSAEAGVGISQFQYKATSGSAPLQQGIKDAQTGEQGLEGFALVNYQFNRYLSVHSGVQYSQEKNDLNYTTTSTSTELSLDTIGWVFDTTLQTQIPIVDTSYVTVTNNQDYLVQNQASYLTLPIGIMFSVPIGVRSEIGIRASALIGFRTKSQGAVLSDLNGTTVDLNSAYLKSGIMTFNASFRYSYALNEKNKIYVEPWIGFGLNNRSTPDLPYDSRFNASGIKIGFRRQF